MENGVFQIIHSIFIMKIALKMYLKEPEVNNKSPNNDFILWCQKIRTLHSSRDIRVYSIVIVLLGTQVTKQGIPFRAGIICNQAHLVNQNHVSFCSGQLWHPGDQLRIQGDWLVLLPYHLLSVLYLTPADKAIKKHTKTKMLYEALLH